MIGMGMGNGSGSGGLIGGKDDVEGFLCGVV